MSERKKKGQPAPSHDKPGERRGQESDIIPGPHGKHGGSLESEGEPQEGEPQDEGRKTTPRRQADGDPSPRR